MLVQPMTAKPDRVKAVIDALVDRGFHFVDTTEANWTTMTGALVTLSGRFPCKLFFPNSLLTIPYICLTEVPEHLKRVAPHIEEDGSLCYAERDTLTFDYFDAANQTLAYVERAEEVLEAIVSGHYDNALHDEFFVYWRTVSGIVYDDRQNRHAGTHQGFFIDSPVTNGHREGYDKEKLVLTDDLQKSVAKLTRAGWTNLETFRARHSVIRVATQMNPQPWKKTWPLKTFGDFLDWQRDLDVRCAQKIEKKFKQGYDKRTRIFHIIVDAPRYSYGVQLVFKDMTKMTKKQILGYGIETLSMTPIGDAYMAGRNTPNRKTLAGLCIVMAGCGTIGGFLSELLVKAGAGTLGGEFILIDDETLNSGNVGRHKLGFESLGQNKAKALATELGRHAPGAVLKPLDMRVETVTLGKFDLLIDATGDETLGHWLVENYAMQAPQLATWIEGAGVAVRSLLRVDSNSGCRRCLCDYRRAGKYTSTKEDFPTTKAGHGCEHLYVPFPATVSVQAACLAAEAIIDWANGVTSPNLRTRITDSTFTQVTADCDMPRRGQCPACTT